MLKYSKHCT